MLNRLTKIIHCSIVRPYSMIKPAIREQLIKAVPTASTAACIVSIISIVFLFVVFLCLLKKHQRASIFFARPPMIRGCLLWSYFVVICSLARVRVFVFLRWLAASRCVFASASSAAAAIRAACSPSTSKNASRTTFSGAHSFASAR